MVACTFAYGLSPAIQAKAEHIKHPIFERGPTLFVLSQEDENWEGPQAFCGKLGFQNPPKLRIDHLTCCQLIYPSHANQDNSSLALGPSSAGVSAPDNPTARLSPPHRRLAQDGELLQDTDKFSRHEGSGSGGGGRFFGGTPHHFEGPPEQKTHPCGPPF